MSKGGQRSSICRRITRKEPLIRTVKIRVSIFNRPDIDRSGFTDRSVV